ncbi:type 1 glutamine amidotransferase domain-containing protein [Roseobacter sinensis]|uniref:Type 1 glutamine amidotransferase domain-containing protein n=1 Tax=Roseobacter sinensis TaxID=2931391 RepID=A0ABT3BAA1_9RHOB|nr:type 1 glutamine amidotransferase domain-containing protein [Roseobacter sp. WL0113]MCV3270134.1 type 1 glutamine amidotransferase domain-containing protein [Roseobacter sp. WL0113]
MTQPNILIVATSADTMHNGEPTGIWLEELTTPFYAFVDGGAKVTVASIKGGAIPVDQRSVAAKGDNDASVERYLEDAETQGLVEASAPITAVLDTISAFDAIFLPGGHGTMFDYPQSAELAQLIETFDRAGKVVAAVCHGPAGLVSARTPDGAPLVSGRTIAAFTDSEERAVGLQDAVPFLLETKLRELGATVSTAPDFQAHAVRDGQLVTGQNPASAKMTAALVLEALAERAAA